MKNFLCRKTLNTSIATVDNMLFSFIFPSFHAQSWSFIYLDSLYSHNALRKDACSEKVRLFHNTQKFFLIHLPISIPVCLVNHFLKLFVSHALTKFFGNTLEILKGNFACLVIIKKLKSLEYLVLRITVEDLLGHHC